MKNIIQFRNGFVNLTNSNSNNMNLAMTVMGELMQFGYILNPTAVSNISSASTNDILSFHKEVIGWLKEMTGSNQNYKPLWPGFPEQVMERSEVELWDAQVQHYLSNGSYQPSEFTKARRTAFEHPSYTVITSGDEDKFLSIFTDLVSVNQSLTPQDLDTVKYFIESGFELRMPNEIPFKENLCTLASMGLDVPVKTTTDVLRIAVGMSGGDISLPKVPKKMVKLNRWSSSKYENPAREQFKFKKFSRSERKRILSLLEKTNCDASEAVLKDGRWIRLGEILHPGEYKTKFPKSFKMFDAIRNTKVKSWYGKVDKSFGESLQSGLSKLSERPGEYMRRMDWLVRSNSSNVEDVMETFNKIAPKVSNKVLFESYTHFEKRVSPVTNRQIMVKGARRATSLPDLPSIDQSVVDRIKETIVSGLKSKFSELPQMGEVFIDEELKNIPLPFNMRSLNPSLRPQIRGTRVPMGNQKAKVIRAFVHWFDEHGNRDIDLTATFLGMGKVKHIGWNGEKNCKEGCYSGDVRHRQGACAEYIDINVAESLKSGFKYAILDARNYNGGTLAEITDCVFGYMEREFPNENEIFVPSTLANSVRLQSSSANTIVAMIDIETQEYVFLDIDQEGVPVASQNFQGILDAIKPYMEKPKFSVYDLLKMHVDGRGQLVDSPEKANTKLMFRDFSNSYIEILKYMGV